MTRSHRLLPTIVGVLFLVIALIVLIPFVMLLLGNFRTPLDIVTRGPLALPQSISFDNIAKVWVEHRFSQYTVNSLIITVPVVLFAVVFANLAAFALAFMSFPLKRLITLMVVVLGVMVSEEFIMIPLFLLNRRLGIVDTYLAAILPQLAMSATFSTLVIWAFLAGIPRDFADAALVAGANSFSVLWRVLTPMAPGPLLTSITLTTVWTWNDYIIPLVMLPGGDKVTLPVGLATFQGAHTIDIPLTMAGTLLTALPMVLLFVLFQKYMVRGLLEGFSD